MRPLGANKLMRIGWSAVRIRRSWRKRGRRATAAPELADYFLKKGELSGAVHAGLTNAKPVPAYVGVDDLGHYEANVSAYLRSNRSAATLRSTARSGLRLRRHKAK